MSLVLSYELVLNYDIAILLTLLTWLSFNYGEFIHLLGLAKGFCKNLMMRKEGDFVSLVIPILYLKLQLIVIKK